jgi:hypothetical protein
LSLGQHVDQFRWKIGWNVVEQVHGSGTMKRGTNEKGAWSIVSEFRLRCSLELNDS